MHGRLKVKTTKEQEEERKIKEREKAYHYRHLSERIFDLRPSIENGENLDDVFKLTSEILLMNPDFYTAWNIRREALLKCVEQDPDSTQQVMRNELTFTLDCLKKNEKSYSVWQHRIWCLSKMPESEYQSEISLCNNFLNKDERNFHCWDYRSYISDLAKMDIETEFRFTTDKIKSNFSNFSAWHRRHKLLLRGLSLPEDECPESCNLKKIWKDEYNLILNAIYTDPSDQSAWLYHNWLVKNSFGNFTQEQLKSLRQLEELEPDNRWLKQATELSMKFVKSETCC